jgi:hypothetical protein
MALERREVLTAVVMKNAIFSAVALLNLCCGSHLLQTGVFLGFFFDAEPGAGPFLRSAG